MNLLYVFDSLGDSLVAGNLKVELHDECAGIDLILEVE